MATKTMQAPAFRVMERHFGYVIAEACDRFSSETLIEAAMRFLGLVLVLSAYAQWLLPGWLFPGDVFLTKAGLSLILGASGVILYWLGARGLALEIEVDLTRREVRVVHRNARGQRRVHSATPMQAVASAFIRRRKDGAGEPKLYLRLRDREDVLHVATGPEAALSRLHARLSADLRPASEKLDRRLAATLPFRSRRVA